MSQSLFKIDGLSAGYQIGRDILQSVSLDIESGEFIAIIGPNGAGKTTLLRCLNGLLPTRTGAIRFLNKPILQWKTAELAREIALVQQFNQSLFHFTVKEMVLMGRFPYLRRFEWEHLHDHDKVEECLRLTNLESFRNRPINTLSGGEVQRVMLARALAQEPKVLLLDEPTAHLDIQHQLNFFQLLQQLNCDRNLTVIAVLHDLNNAAMFARRLLLMHDGKITADGVPREVLTVKRIQHVYGIEPIIHYHPQNQQPQIFLPKKGQ